MNKKITRRKAKSWTQRQRCSSIEARFAVEEDGQRRVYLSAFWLSPVSAARLERLSAAAELSRSAWLEQRVNQAMLLGIKVEKTTLSGGSRRSYGGAGLSKRGWKEYKKLMIHPVILGMLREKKESLGVSWSVLMESIVSAKYATPTPFLSQ